MRQSEFDQALKHLVRLPLNTAKFQQVKPVAEALMYSNYLPKNHFYLNNVERRRVAYLFEKFRRYSCSTTNRRLELKNFVSRLQLEHSLQSSSNQFLDPLARNLGLAEDLNHLKAELLSLQTRHYQSEK